MSSGARNSTSCVPASMHSICLRSSGSKGVNDDAWVHQRFHARARSARGVSGSCCGFSVHGRSHLGHISARLSPLTKVLG